MPRPPKKAKVSLEPTTNPSFGAVIRNCKFCDFAGTSANLARHQSQSECQRRYAIARHALHPDTGVIDGQYCPAMAQSTETNNRALSAAFVGHTSPPQVNQFRTEDNDDDSFALPDDFSDCSNPLVLYTQNNAMEHNSLGDIEMTNIMGQGATDDDSVSSVEFILQLVQPGKDQVIEHNEQSIAAPIEAKELNDILGDVLEEGQFSTSSQMIFLSAKDPQFQIHLSTKDIFNLKLLQLMDNGNLPHYYFPSVLSWAREASIEKYDFTNIIHDRNTVVNTFRNRFPNLPTCTTVDIQLESVYNNTRETARMVVWSMAEIIQNLFFDREIWGNAQNINCNKEPGKLFHPFETGPEDYIGEAITGAWYERTIQQLKDDPDIKFNPETDMCIPLKFSFDATHIDIGGRHKVTALMVTTNLIKWHIQNHPRSWRHVGLMPDLQKMSKAAAKMSRNTPGGRGRPIRNWHACMSEILRSMKMLMREPISMLIRIGDHVQVKRCFLLHHLSNLDGQEKDKWCGRYSSHHPSMKTVGHGCLTPVHQCSNLGHCCKPLNQFHLQHLSWTATHGDNDTIRNAALEQLHQFSQYRHTSAFNDILYGANPRGIPGTMCTDIMHANREGLISHCCTILMSSLNNSRRSKIDTEVKRMFVKCPGQSTRDEYPRIKWSNGITHVTQLAGHEWIGVLMVTSIMSNTFSCRNQFITTDKNKKDTVPSGLSPYDRPGEMVNHVGPHLDFYQHEVDIDIPISYSNPVVTNLKEQQVIIQTPWGTPLDLVVESTNEAIDSNSSSDSSREGDEKDSSISSHSTDEDDEAVNPNHDIDSEQPDEVDEEGYYSDGRSLDSEEMGDCHYDETLPQVDDAEDPGLPENSKGVKKKKYTYGTKDLPHPDDLIRVFEVLCCWDAFSREKQMCKKKNVEGFIRQLKQLVDRMLAMVFAILPRMDGNKWDSSKVHAILHIPDSIAENGAPYNWNTETQESNHKHHSKAHAATAQKRKEEIYLPQVGSRIDTSHMLDYIRRNAGLPSLNPIASESVTEESWYIKSEYTGVTQNTPAWVLGADEIFHFYHVGSDRTPPVVRNYVLNMMKKSKVDAATELCAWEKNPIGKKPTGHMHQIRGYTEAAVNGVPFRAAPLYQKEKDWYDWCKVVYEDDEDQEQIAAAKLLVFLEWTYESPASGQPEDKTPDHQAPLIHWCHSRNASDYSLDTLLQTSWRLAYEKEWLTSSVHNPKQASRVQTTVPYIDVIDFRNIKCQAFVVEETPGVQETEPAICRVIEIAPRSEWASIFLNEDWFLWVRNLYQKRKLKANQQREFIGYNGRRFAFDGGDRRKEYSPSYKCVNPNLIGEE